MRFRVGDVVRLKKDSVFHDTDRNPKNTNGRITNISTVFAAIVWNNGHDNAYHESDLRLVKRGENNER